MASQSFSDKKVLALASSQGMVSGTSRFKYFRRPVMPQIAPVEPNVLLAPKSEDPLIPIEEIPEPTAKNVETQTIYRESEAQTIPYTPDYVIQDGENPEVLLLKDLTYENGLPLGKKELEIIQHARVKRILETNVPPFTDEASLILRKRLMEKQELKELKFRENEIDAKREERLGQLRQALLDRDENNEFLSAQRVEAVRQSRMEEREKLLNKIRSKRIKVLRRLANERSKVDPVLHERNPRNIIDDHYEKASDLYAPKLRDGKEHKVERTKFDVMMRTANLSDIDKLADLESKVPKQLTIGDESSLFSPLRAGELFSNTAPAILGHLPTNHLLDDRLTSAARRDLKNTKRNVEEMNRIIQHGKRNAQSIQTTQSLSSADTRTSQHSAKTSSAPSTANNLVTLSRRVKGRPVTPDLAVDEKGDPIPNDNKVHAAIIFLQSVIRGRAVQNIMIEGKYRRKELIAELRRADEYFKSKDDSDDTAEMAKRLKEERDLELKTTTEDNIIGSLTSNFVYQLASETVRFLSRSMVSICLTVD